MCSSWQVTTYKRKRAQQLNSKHFMQSTQTGKKTLAASDNSFAIAVDPVFYSFRAIVAKY